MIGQHIPQILSRMQPLDHITKRYRIIFNKHGHDILPQLLPHFTYVPSWNVDLADLSGLVSSSEGVKGFGISLGKEGRGKGGVLHVSVVTQEVLSPTVASKVEFLLIFEVAALDAPALPDLEEVFIR